jgi:hypothetical protein
MMHVEMTKEDAVLLTLACHIVHTDEETPSEVAERLQSVCDRLMDAIATEESPAAHSGLT